MYSEAHEFIWPSIFEFPNGAGESVVWAQYAPQPIDVHGHGSEIEARIQKRKPETKYEGYISSQAGTVRQRTNARGHGFRVSHAPEEGVHHAEIHFAPKVATEFTKLDRNELKEALKTCFSPLQVYDRAANPQA
jgi:hypothetical protein